MLGYIEFSGGAMRLAREQRCGGTFLVLDMGRSAGGIFAKRRAARAAERMLHQGVRRAVFPVGFPYMEIFLRRGIVPVDPLPLRRVLAARFVKRELERRGIAAGEAVVAVVADHAQGAPADTVRELVQIYRHVALSVRSGGEELARTLRRQCGAAILQDPSVELLRRADALILFEPPAGVEPENPVLCTLYCGATGRGCVPIALEEALLGGTVPDCVHEQMAAALYSMGILGAERFLGEFTC